MKPLLAILALWAAVGPAAAARAEFALTSEDRVVFWGDTLAEAQRFPRQIETFVRVKYPQLRTRFINCSLRNQTAADALRRLDEDLKPLSPTVVVVVLGLYDADLQPLSDRRLKEFRENYENIILQIQQLKARIVLVTPPLPASDRLIDHPTVRYSAVIAEYARTIKELAAAHSVHAIDWFESSSEFHRQLGQASSEERQTFHSNLAPSAWEDMIVAAQLLKHWNAEPIRVDIEANWNSPAARISVGNIEVGTHDPSDLVLVLKGVPLPWSIPAHKPGEPAVPQWPGADLCQFNLRVHGLPEEGVHLRWRRDEVPVNRDELEAGANVADWPPIQFCPPLQDLVRQISKKHGYRFKYWRHVRPRRPKEPELQEAFEAHTRTLQLYEEGTAEIILRLPKTFDTVLHLHRNEPTGPENAASTLPASTATE